MEREIEKERNKEREREGYSEGKRGICIKKADVMNKLGIVALFNNREEDALKYWHEAKVLNDHHFDSTCNYVMYRWSTGRITDAQMMQELEENAFDQSKKGAVLQAYLNLAIGNLELGRSQLQSFVDEIKLLLPLDIMFHRKKKTFYLQ